MSRQTTDFGLPSLASQPVSVGSFLTRRSRNQCGTTLRVVNRDAERRTTICAHGAHNLRTKTLTAPIRRAGGRTPIGSPAARGSRRGNSVRAQFGETMIEFRDWRTGAVRLQTARNDQTRVDGHAELSEGERPSLPAIEESIDFSAHATLLPESRIDRGVRARSVVAKIPRLVKESTTFCSTSGGSRS